MATMEAQDDFDMSMSSEDGSVKSLVDRRVGVERGMAGQGTLSPWPSVTFRSSWSTREEWYKVSEPSQKDSVFTQEFLKEGTPVSFLSLQQNTRDNQLTKCNVCFC